MSDEILNGSEGSKMNPKNRALCTIKKVVICFIVIIVVCFGYVGYESLPKRISKNWGVSIGQSEADVLIAHGAPYNSEIKKDKSNNDLIYKTSSYQSHVTTVTIEYIGVDENSLFVNRICHFGYSFAEDELKVNGLDNDDHLSFLLERLGEPSSKSISNDKLRAIYNYDRYNLYFMIESGKIVSVCVTDGSSYSFNNDK